MPRFPSTSVSTTQSKTAEARMVKGHSKQGDREEWTSWTVDHEEEERKDNGDLDLDEDVGDLNLALRLENGFRESDQFSSPAPSIWYLGDREIESICAAISDSKSQEMEFCYILNEGVLNHLMKALALNNFVLECVFNPDFNNVTLKGTQKQTLSIHLERNKKMFIKYLRRAIPTITDGWTYETDNQPTKKSRSFQRRIPQDIADLIVGFTLFGNI